MVARYRLSGVAGFLSGLSGLEIDVGVGGQACLAVPMRFLGVGATQVFRVSLCGVGELVVDGFRVVGLIWCVFLFG